MVQRYFQKHFKQCVSVFLVVSMLSSHLAFAYDSSGLSVALISRVQNEVARRFSQLSAEQKREFNRQLEKFLERAEQVLAGLSDKQFQKRLEKAARVIESKRLSKIFRERVQSDRSLTPEQLQEANTLIDQLEAKEKQASGAESRDQFEQRLKEQNIHTRLGMLEKVREFKKKVTREQVVQFGLAMIFVACVICALIAPVLVGPLFLIFLGGCVLWVIGEVIYSVLPKPIQ